MTELVNQPGGDTLLDIIRQAALATTGARGRRTFVALTCYVDETAVEELA